MKHFRIGDIKKGSLCIGCGLCQAVNPDINMIQDSRGFIVPDANGVIEGETGDLLNELCPGININCVSMHPTPFGKVIELFDGWANDKEVRFRASSGGVITALGIFLIQSKIVDGIIQVGKDPAHYMHNKVFISRTKDEVEFCASSRYSPVSMFCDIFEVLENDKDTYAFIGKPCDIATIKKLVEKKKEYNGRIRYYISLVCAGTPSFHATESLVYKGKYGKNIYPVCVKYRGDGWPGNFKVIYDDNSAFECDYNESWGKVLGRNLSFRCKICPDGVGKEADIVVGDSWATKDGYPDFSEQDGRSFILVRTDIGLRLIDNAAKAGYITTSVAEISKLKSIQPYQFQRLLYSGYKLLGAKLCVGSLIKVSGFSFQPSVFIKGLKNTLGTIKRFKRL